MTFIKVYSAILKQFDDLVEVGREEGTGIPLCNSCRTHCLHNRQQDPP